MSLSSHSELSPSSWNPFNFLINLSNTLFVSLISLSSFSPSSCFCNSLGSAAFLHFKQSQLCSGPVPFTDDPHFLQWKLVIFLSWKNKRREFKLICLQLTKPLERMKENKVRELQSLSLQQATGHRIVVEWPRQNLAKK